MATQEEIDRLSAGVKAAVQQGNTDIARALGQKLRAITSQQAAVAEPEPADIDAAYRRNMDAATADMPTGQRFRAGMASGALQAGNAIINTVNDLAEWIDSTAIGGAISRAGQAAGLPSTAEARRPADEYRREVVERDAPLQNTTAGRVGSVVGTGAVLAPTALIPGANTYAGAALVGAGTGAALSESGERAGGAGVGAVGGVAGKAVGDKVASVLRDAVSFVRTAVTGSASPEQAARAAVRDALAKNGMSVADLPDEAQKAIIAEVRQALSVGDVVDEAALGRKADFLAIGATPTAGTISRDPQQYALEHTLRGVQGAGRDLADIAQQNNQVLIGTLNKAGAAQAPGRVEAGREILDAGQKFWDVKNQSASQLWDAAKQQGGRVVKIDAKTFSTAVDDKLAHELKADFLPPKIAAMFERFRAGEIPLTVETAEQFKTMLATASRSSQDGNERAAIGIVRDALESAPLAASTASSADDAGSAAIAAFNRARAATRDLKTNVESIPAVKAAIDGAEPDKIFDKMVINGELSGVRQLGRLLAENPDKHAAVKAQLVDYLKQKALNGATDEVGNFSQSAYNRALAQLTTKKLEALGFSPDEINVLKTVGRVSSYIQAAPAGSSVNRSNTAAQGYNLLSMVMDSVVRKLPFGAVAIADPAMEVAGSAISRSATNAAIPKTRLPMPTDVVGRTVPAGTSTVLLDQTRGGQEQRR